MSESFRNMLSLGALLIIMVVVILLTALQIISIGLVVPIFLVLVGCWTLALALMRSWQPKKYASDASGTMGLGVVLIALGGAWYLFSINWLFSLALILFVLGALAIAAALRGKQSNRN